MRLFVALSLPAAVRREAGRRIAAERGRLPRARWVHADNLHLTLVFVGEVAEPRVPALTEALAPAFAVHPPVRLHVVGAGTFPPPSRGRSLRVAWLGVEVEAGVESLRALHADVTAAVTATVDVTLDDRPFAPHLTVARPKERWRRQDGEAFIAAFHEPTGEPFTVTAGHLMRSELGRGPGGAPRYAPLAELPLLGVA